MSIYFRDQKKLGYFLKFISFLFNSKVTRWISIAALIKRFSNLQNGFKLEKAPYLFILVICIFKYFVFSIFFLFGHEVLRFCFCFGPPSLDSCVFSVSLISDQTEPLWILSAFFSSAHALQIPRADWFSAKKWVERYPVSK